MAVDKRKNVSQEVGAEAGLTQKRRWLVFGSNVAVALVLATALAVAAVWLSGALLKGKTRSDWTQSGRFSLSPKSKALAGQIEKDLTLAMVSPDPNHCLYEDAEDYRRDLDEYERMRDLLEEYGMASGRIHVEYVDPLDMAQAETFLAKLKERYREQLASKDALLKEGTQFRDEVDKFVAQELAQVTSVGTAEPAPPAAIIQAMTVAANELIRLSARAQADLLSKRMGVQLAPPDEEVTLPDAKTLAANVAQRFKEFPEFYKRVLEAAGKGPQTALPGPVKAFLEAAATRYEPLAKQAEELQKKLDALPKQKFDEVKDSIASQKRCLVFQTPDDVEVVPLDDAWVRPPERDEDTPETEKKPLFVGERVINASLLGITQKEKPALLFVTFGAPATMPSFGGPFGGGGGGPYAQMAERLRKSNFIVEDWDLMRSPEMPRPEHMSKAILVFVPPSPPNPQMPMPPPNPDSYKAALEAVRGGTPALVFGEPGSMFSPGVPYADLFEWFGVTAKLNALNVHRVIVNNAGLEKAVPQIDITSYADSPITQPLNGLPSVFYRSSPLGLAKSPPEGVTVVPLATLPTGPDYWADTNMIAAQRGEAKRDEGEDLFSTEAEPVVLAAAATRKLKDAEQKVVLFGAGQFAADGIAFWPAPGREMYPGNAELVVNCALWVAGTDHLISVSPEALLARRLSDPGTWALPLKAIIIVGLPAVVLLIGLVVYVVRRR